MEESGGRRVASEESRRRWWAFRFSNQPFWGTAIDATLAYAAELAREGTVDLALEIKA